MKQHAIALSLLLICVTTAQADPSEKPKADGWLTGAETDAVRVERLERYLRGFDQPMWEVGERFEHVEQALRDKNWALADYHWDKIKVTIEGGLMKRPKRRANAQALFLGEPWEQFDQALKSGDASRISTSFNRAKGACMACHAAEKVGFINDQPLFRRLQPQP